MDSIFPELGSNPFKTVPPVDDPNPGRKAEATNASRPVAGYPSRVEKSDSSQNQVAHPGRGKRIDYLA